MSGRPLGAAARLVACGLVIATPVGAARPDRDALERASRRPAPTGAAPASWVAQVQAALAADEYQLRPRDGIDGLTAPNRGRDLRGTWHAGVFELQPRVDAAAWHFSLHVIAAGRAGAGPVAPVAVQDVSGARLEWRHADGLVEWYSNANRGIEQGFSVPARPAGRGPLVIACRVTGLVPRVMPDGQAVVLRTAAGRDAVRLGNLRASDASGTNLSARFVVTSETVTIEVDDREAAFPVDVDPLFAGAAWTVDGGQPGDGFGLSVASAGDVNGDGYSDVIIGAPYFDAGLTDQGRALVYEGSPAGLSSTPAWTMDGDQTSADFGFSVASAGDVNGDGYSEVIVGAENEAAPQADQGRAYVYQGSPSGPSRTPRWTASGPVGGADFGFCVAPAGDVNGDGYADVIIGSNGDAPASADGGQASVYLGSPAGLALTPCWTVVGQPGSELGTSVAGAGDVDGDGYSDVLVGAPWYANGQAGEGRADLYLGSPTGPSLTAAWSVESGQLQAGLGRSVAAAGDVNGDGHADVLVGTPWWDGVTTTDAGRVDLYLGGATGLSANPSWTLLGTQDGAELGRCVATAGDVDGDGLADVLLAEPFYDDGETDEGRVSLYQGSPAGVVSTPSWVGEGNQVGALFGLSAAMAGDLDADGRSDVIVGAERYSASQSLEGRAWVFRGQTSGLAADPAWTSEGGQRGAAGGAAVASAGDVNGDGFSDVLVGAPGYDAGAADTGRASLFLGSPTGLSVSPAWVADGDQPGALFGWCVAAAGDVNGDGYSDFVIGAPYHTQALAQEGRVSIFFGSSTGPATTPDATVDGGQDGALFGWSVAGAGDVNADGFSDVLVGAPDWLGSHAQEGAAFLLAGSAVGPSSASAWSALGGQVGAHLGTAVGSAGDVDADGHSDVIVGAPDYSGSHASEGRVVLFRGSVLGPSLAPDWTAEGGQDGAHLGASLADAGDVNADGYSDVLVGAPGATGTQPGEGCALLYLGSPSGLAGATPAWTAWGGQAAAEFGTAVASAGDVNGDGYSDVLIGAPGASQVQPDEGLVTEFDGSASGPAATPSWTARGGQAGAALGASVACAGDVNGDGYSDVIVGAPSFDDPDLSEGRALVYEGDAGLGALRIPRMRHADDSGPIDLLDAVPAPGGFRVHVNGSGPFGRDRLRLVVEVKPLGAALDGTAARAGVLTDTGQPDLGGGDADLSLPTGALAPGPWRWRVQIRGSVPVPWQSRWMSLPGNAMTETDLRLAGPPVPCLEPSALDLRPGAAPLSVTRAVPPNVVTLRWEDVSAPAYAVYGGLLSDLRPARPRPTQLLCRVQVTSADVPAAGPGLWFLVASTCATGESSYGRESGGRERDHAVVPCP